VAAWPLPDWCEQSNCAAQNITLVSGLGHIFESDGATLGVRSGAAKNSIRLYRTHRQRCWALATIEAGQRRHQMNQTEFMKLHRSCVIAMRAYSVQMEKTATMLGECTSKPLSFKKRFRLMTQGIVENDTHMIYLGAKRLLVNAARLGYACSN
jgi:hypothetical protein